MSKEDPAANGVALRVAVRCSEAVAVSEIVAAAEMVE